MAKLPTYEDLLKADRASLTTLRSDVDKAIRDSEANARKSAKNELEARARELGFSVSDLFGSTGTTKQRVEKSPAAPKYAHPENTEKTWSGRGRQPDWVKNHLEGGKHLDDLLIK